MDSESPGATKLLHHIDVHVDELEPRKGILDLLRRLCPQWKPHDIQMKASGLIYMIR